MRGLKGVHKKRVTQKGVLKRVDSRGGAKDENLVRDISKSYYK